jgi:hypothetical protein
MTNGGFDFREEVLNVELARMLEGRGLLSVPETIRRATTGRTHRLPDVTIADLWGLRITIEGKVNSGGNARTAVLTNAQGRVEEGISPISLAVLYPQDLRQAQSMPGLRRALARATLRVRVVSEHDDGDWVDANVDNLADILRNAYDIVVGEDLVVRSVEDLGASIEGATEIIADRPASVERLRRLLGIPESAGAAEPDEDD